MKEPKLTPTGADATLDQVHRRVGHGRGLGMNRIAARAGVMMAGFAVLGGCINIAAPDEPIVIQLDINIRAEVLYRLAEDASNTIDENADIF